MTAPIDHTGQIFGRLRVLSLYGKAKGGLVWLCQCQCGKQCRIQGSSLRNGKTQSCGCFLVEVLKKRPQSRLAYSNKLKSDGLDVQPKKKITGTNDRIYWTSDDIILLVVCRTIYYMSYNDIARILNVCTQTVVELAEKIHLFHSGEVIRGRNPHWRKTITHRYNMSDSWLRQ